MACAIGDKRNMHEILRCSERLTVLFPGLNRYEAWDAADRLTQYLRAPPGGPTLKGETYQIFFLCSGKVFTDEQVSPCTVELFRVWKEGVTQEGNDLVAPHDTPYPPGCISIKNISS